jgi:cystathionine beta-synthase
MAGGSSVTDKYAAVKYCQEKNLGKDKVVVVVMPGNIMNYLTKHLNSDWMYERGYKSE